MSSEIIVTLVLVTISILAVVGLELHSRRNTQKLQQRESPKEHDTPQERATDGAPKQ